MALTARPGPACAARRDLRRRRRELRGLLRERHGHGPVPLRRATASRRASRSASDAARLARLRPRRPSGTALRLSRARPVRPDARAPASIANKLLVDPYARAIEGKIDYREPVFALRRLARSRASPARTRAPTIAPPTCATARAASRRRSSSTISASTGKATAIRACRGPTPSSTRRTSRGSRAAHPDVPEAIRGTYLGLAHAIRSSSTCKRLGVTTVELLPIHERWTSGASPRAG